MMPALPAQSVHPDPRRRAALGLAATLPLLAALALRPARANAATPMAPMTDGPFYPPPRWRTHGPFAGDWDADLTRVQRAGARLAMGEHLALALELRDTRGKAIDGVAVEIWQCDARAQYRHPRVSHDRGQHDEGFQGYGEAQSSRDGTLRFRTIRPVPYPGRTPHIHIKLRHASFGEIGSQLFVAGDAGNDADFLWRQLDPAERQALAMSLAPATADGLRWQARHTLVLPA